MATPNPSPITVSLKLLIHPKSKRLVFAEAGKDFVDFLFNIISLPAGTMIKLLSKQVTAGCTGNLTFMKPNYNALYSEEGAGFVKGAVTYMIMDDLVVKPTTTESIITLLNKFRIKGLGDLEVKVVDVGVDEGVELLRASMQSKMVLTAVFLPARKETFSWWIKCLLFFCFFISFQAVVHEWLSEQHKGPKSPL